MPAGSPTHAVLYVNTIFGKGIGNIDVNDTLKANKRLDGSATVNDEYAIAGGHPSSQMVGQLGFLQAGVRGLSVSTKNEGRLGTATAGVEGFGTIGVKGIYGSAPTNSYGYLGHNYGGVYGYGSGYDGVYGEVGTDTPGTAGVWGKAPAAATSAYAGYFTGGKGLYASKIKFGPDAFGIPTGALILGAAGTLTCTNVCASHSLNCDLVYTVTGTPSTCGSSNSGARYCWCD